MSVGGASGGVRAEGTAWDLGAVVVVFALIYGGAHAPGAFSLWTRVSSPGTPGAVAALVGRALGVGLALAGIDLLQAGYHAARAGVEAGFKSE